MHEALIQDLLDMSELHLKESGLRDLLIEAATALGTVTANAPVRAQSARSQLEEALQRQRSWKKR